MNYFAKFSVTKIWLFFQIARILAKSDLLGDPACCLPEPMRDSLSCPRLLNRTHFLSLIHSRFE